MSHLVILEMHNGDSNINNIPFCKVSTTYEVFSTGNKYIMNDNIVSNKIQNTMLSVYPSMIQYLFDTQSNMSTDNTIAVYFTNTDRCENASYLYNAYNFKAW